MIKTQNNTFVLPQKRFIIYYIIGLLVAIVLFVTAALVADRQAVARHEQMFNDQQALQTFLAKQAMEDHVNWTFAEVRILATHSVPEFAQGKRDIASLRDLFRTELMAYPENLSYTYLDAQASVVHSHTAETPGGTEAGRLSLEWANTYWSDLRDWTEPDPFVAPFYVTNDYQMAGLLFPVRVIEGGELSGVLVVVMDLQPMIMRYVAPMRSGQYGAGYLLDEGGRIVYDHETEIIGLSVFDGMHDKYPDLMRVDRRLVSEPSGIDEYSFTVQRGGQVSRKLIAWHALSIGERKLVVCLSAPDIEIDETLSDLRLQRILLGGSLALALLVMSFLFFRARQQMLEQSARELQVRLGLALSGADLGLWDWNVQTDEMIINQRWAEMLEYSLDEIEPHINSWKARLHPDDASLVEEALAAYLEGRASSYETEHRLQARSGEWKWVLDRARIVEHDEDDKPLRMAGTHLDITELKQTAQEIHELNLELEHRVIRRTAQLEAANKELEAFAYSVSHDLRAPLRAISGFSRILVEDYAPKLSPEVARYLQMVRDNAQQMDQLIDDLLVFSRLSRQPLKKQPVAPADLARQAFQDLGYEQEGRHVEFSVGDLPACQGDPALLKQVFVNLLANALKFTRGRDVARIEVGCQQMGDEIVYFVRDNGVGFDMQYEDKLFGVFQRLHRAEEYEGTGIGLATIQRIVHRHEGRIWAEAQVDQGATFYFTLEGDIPHD